MAQASISIKKCELYDAELHIKDAYHTVTKALKEDEEGRYHILLPKIKNTINHIMSVIISTKGSLNVADNAARLSGMCDALAMIME